MTNGQIFRAAADYIREHGLHKGDAGHHGRPRCAFGALVSVILGQDYWDGNARVLEMETVAAERVSGSRAASELFRWNDAPERTAEEVIALLEGLSFDEDLKAAAQSPLPADVDKTIPLPVQIPQLVEA